MEEQFCLEFGGNKCTGTGKRIFVNIKWPPPKEMTIEGIKYELMSYSKMPKYIPGIMRGAKYLEKQINGNNNYS